MKLLHRLRDDSGVAPAVYVAVLGGTHLAGLVGGSMWIQCRSLWCL